MKHQFIDHLDGMGHTLYDWHLLPRFVVEWICDAYDYRLTGGEFGKKNWPLNR